MGASRNMTDLTGRSAIVTGAGSGIGRAIALTLAQNGAKVMVNDIIAQRAEETTAMITDAGGEAVTAVADVAAEDQVVAFVNEAADRWGKIDILCSNAGVMDLIEPIHRAPTESWDRIMAVNATGVFFTIRESVKHMLKAGSGSIIVTASQAGIRGGPAGPIYVASKHAAVGLTRNVAWTYRDKGIRCNAICPGGTATNIAGAEGLDSFDKEGIGISGPAMALGGGVVASPQEMADVVLFLASDLSRHVSGTIIPVDLGVAGA